MLGKKEEEEDDDEVSMGRNEFIKEHRKLIKILKKGDKHELLMEAVEQEKELNEYLNGD